MCRRVSGRLAKDAMRAILAGVGEFVCTSQVGSKSDVTTNISGRSLIVFAMMLAFNSSILPRGGFSARLLSRLFCSPITNS